MMRYRTLGRTGVQVSCLCLGCMHFGRKTEPDDALAIVDRAIDGGINFVDTANAYGRGTSEEILGRALQRNGHRDRVVLATKVYGRMDDDDPNASGLSRRHIIAQCEASLKRLGTDWIDLYQMHRPMPDLPIDESLRAMDDLVRAGKVRYVGTSSFPAWQVMELLWTADRLNTVRSVCEQPPFHMLDRRVERELVPLAERHGLGIICWAPLAEGFLTGKYSRGQSDRPEGRLSNTESGWANRHFVDRAFAVVEQVQEIAADKGCTPAQFVLAWTAARPGVTAPILGPRTMAQLDDSLGAADVEVTDEDTVRIDKLIRSGEVIVPYYNQSWQGRRFR